MAAPKDTLAPGAASAATTSRLTRFCSICIASRTRPTARLPGPLALRLLHLYGEASAHETPHHPGPHEGLPVDRPPAPIWPPSGAGTVHALTLFQGTHGRDQAPSGAQGSTVACNPLLARFRHPVEKLHEPRFQRVLRPYDKEAIALNQAVEDLGLPQLVR
jgi:hypothetical protein